MIRQIAQHLLKKRLIDDKYLFLLNSPPEDEYIAFDTETSGLNTKTAEILSIGAVKIVKNRILTSQSFEVHIRPEEPISPTSIKIHGLRHIDLADGVPIENAVKRFLYFVGNRPLVGYNIQFDVKMINKTVRKITGISLPNKKIELAHLYRKKKRGIFTRKTFLSWI
ncbi:MAG: 3'-5' exonuclease [Spirochaetota bacterium]|nr:3'-5' exonuclease [Spirochaetota bacterium]